MAFRNLKKFNAALVATAIAQKAKAKLAFKKLILEVARRAINRTPIDTGRLRGGWQITLSPEVTDNGRINKGRGDVTSEMVQAVQALDLGMKAYISNAVEYAGYVEKGTDRMEGRFMLALALQEVTQALRAA